VSSDSSDYSERTVGAALCGRPYVEVNRQNANTGAATEGRPYSTFRGHNDAFIAKISVAAVLDYRTTFIS